MPKTSEINQKRINKLAAVILKPNKNKRKSIAKTSTNKDTPNNKWIDDPIQGCVFVIDGIVLMVDKSLKTKRVRWEEYTRKGGK